MKKLIELGFSSTYRELRLCYGRYLDYSEYIFQNPNDVLEEMHDTVTCDLLDCLIEVCSALYVETLSSDPEVRREQFYSDLRKSALDDDLLRLELLMSALYTKVFVDEERSIDELLFVLDQLVKSLVSKISFRDVHNRMVIVDKILDEILERNDDITNTLSNFLDLKLEKLEWYSIFYSNYTKLGGLMPVSKKSLEVLKKGLLCPDKHLASVFQDYIQRLYVNEGLIDKKYNWIVSPTTPSGK